MFVCVRYGDGDSVILNTDCGLRVFIECLRQKCNIIESSTTVDLVDEFGKVQYLSRNGDPEARVSNILVDRLKYILVELKTEENEIIVKPLLKNWIARTGTSPEPPPTTKGGRDSFTRPKLKTITKAIIAFNKLGYTGKKR